MPMRQKGRKIYRTMQGKQIDLDLLIKRNELTPAVGNAKVNARGDELGPGGKIIRKREEVVREYYKGSKPVANEEAVSQERQTPQAAESAPVKPTATEQKMLDEFDAEPIPVKKTSTKTTSNDDWIEDEDGNFIKK